MKNETINEEPVANYKFISLKGAYEFNKNLSAYFEIGNLSLGFPEDYGEDTFAYGGGLDINIFPSKKINIILRGEFLNFSEKSENKNGHDLREVKWKEYRPGIFIEFYKDSLFSPYFGIYKFIVDSDLNFTDTGSISKNKLKHNDNGSSQEITSGVKINYNSYILDIQIRTTGKDSKNYDAISSLKIAAGKVF